MITTSVMIKEMITIVKIKIRIIRVIVFATATRSNCNVFLSPS